MADDPLYSGIQDTLKKHGIGLPAAPTAPPASEITAPAPAPEGPDLRSGIMETLKKHGIGMAGEVATPAPAGKATLPPATPDDAKYETKLSPEEEPKFQKWLEDHHKAGNIKEGDYRHYKEQGYGAGYDFRAAYQKGLTPGEDGHWSDYGKKPSHETFSVESKYASEPGTKPGRWEGGKYIPFSAEPVPTGFGGEVKKPGGLPEALAPTAPGPQAIPPSEWAKRSVHNLIEPSLREISGTAELAKKLPFLFTGIPGGAIIPMIQGWLAGKAQEALNEYLPTDQKEYAGAGLAEFPSKVAGALIPYAVGGGVLKAAGMKATTFAGKLLINTGIFGSVDIPTGYHEAGTAGALKALWHSPLTALMFTLAGQVPGGRIPTSLAVGTAGAGSAAAGGEKDPWKLAESFGTMVLLHNIMGFGKGEAPEGKPEHDPEKLIQEWMEKNNVTPRNLARISGILRDAAPENDDISPEIKSIFDKTPQPETRTPEEQRQAIVEGPLGKIIEGQENRNDAIRQMMAEHGLEGKQAERFYDLYEKGDATTALKEFPEFSSWATEAQKRAAVVPAEGAEIPEPASGPMATSGLATERTEAPAAAGISSETEEYIRLRKMVNKVQLSGDPEAAGRLNDLIKANPEIANLFKPTDNADWARLEPILTKMSDLMKKVEDTGDPIAAKDLHDYIKANPEALKGFPRWPVEVAPTADMVTSPAHAVNPAGRSNTTETPAEAVKLSESPAPKASPEPEPPSSAPAQAGGGGTVGLSATPAGEAKPAAPAEAAAAATPMGSPGSIAEAAAKPAEVPPGPAPDPLKEAKEFRTKFGSRQGPPDVGIEEQPVKVWMPPSKRPRNYDMGRAIEHGDIDTMILANGGFNSKSEIFRNFEPEERLKLFRYMRSKEKFPHAKGPDEMFQDFKKDYPHLMPWESEADWLMALIRGDHKNFLMGDKVYEDLEAQHEYNLKEAKREGYSPEDVAAAEEELERQIAAEEAAGRGAGAEEPAPGAGWIPGVPEPAPGLSAPKKPTAKLETRLDEIHGEYPDLDREKAATVIRAFPGASNGHIAAMSADPEMFNQVAKGNLAASERLQLLKKATDSIAQQGLPGMEGLSGDRLFLATNERELARGLTTEQIQDRLGKSGTVSEISPEMFAKEDQPYSHGWLINLKNGQMGMVFVAKDGSLKVGPNEVVGGWAALGIESFEGRTIAGSFKPTDFGGVTELAKGQGLRSFDHESWHWIEHWLLNDKERAAIVKDFGDNEEGRAEAYAKWNPKEAPNTVFQKILDFFQNIVKAITGKVTGEDVFKAAREGKLFEREPAERLPEALAPRLRAEEPLLSKPELNRALTQGGLTLEEYNARYAEKYGEWGGRKWTENFPDFDAMGVRMAREDGTVVSERKFQMEEAAEEGWDILGGITGKVTGNVEAAKGWYDRVGRSLTSMFNAPRLSKEALKTHQSIVASQAAADTEIKRMTGEFKQYAEQMGPITNEANQEFLRLYQAGEVDKINHPLFKAFGEFYRQEERRQMGVMKALGKAPKELPHYIDQLWERNEALDRVEQQILSSRSMTGPDYFFLLRQISDIPTGIASGFIPKYGTIAEMALAGRTARERFIAARTRINDLKENGYQRVVKNREQIPVGWKQLPGAYGEVWAKIERPGGFMIPKEAIEGALPMGGGPERMGYEEVPGLKGWQRVGYRIAPEDVAIQFENFLGRGLKGGDIYSIYHETIHAIRYAQMAFSWFHFMFENINSMATKSGLGVTNALGGLFTGDFPRMGKGLGEMATAPAALIQDIKGGLKLNNALLNPKGADPLTLAHARTLVSGGMRIEVETKLSKILARSFQDSWGELKGGHLGKSAAQFVKGLSSGIMDYVVPFAKNGSTYRNYLAEVDRFERDNGRLPNYEESQNLAYESREMADDAFGRITMDNIGMNATAKSLLSGVIQFPTWNIGSVKIFGRAAIGAKDVMMKAWDVMQGREGRTIAIKDRQALQYTAGMLFTVGLIGGLTHYALTGNKPETLEDFYFPKTGQVLPNGADERIQFPSYLKDALGITRHPWQTVSAKMAAPIHIVTDLIQNRDYWGNQIYDPHDWGQKLPSIAWYLTKSTSPFILQSFEQGAQQTPERAAMSLFGVRPVPRELANTPAQNVIDEYNQMMRATTTTKETAEKKTLKGDLLKMARNQDESGFQEAAGQAVSEGKITRQQVKEIVEESQAPPGMKRFIKLPLEWAVRAWGEASDFEKQQWQPYFLKKVMSEKPENLIKMRDEVAGAMDEMGLSSAADAVRSLTMPEGVGVDLSGLGMVGAAPEMGGMEAVDSAIAAALGSKFEAKAKPISSLARPPSTREKKRPYGVLGL
jgi:hypothetical protein